MTISSPGFSRAFGEKLDPDQVDKLSRYQAWLSSEASIAGAIGPKEEPRITDRHLNDSLAYARFLPPGVGPVYDLGSGAGLPGIPLAVALPNREFVLIDRSRRRVDLLERAARVLDLGNVEAFERDLVAFDRDIEVAVARAVLQPEQWRDMASKALKPGGLLVIAVGDTSRTPQSTTELSVVRHELNVEVLDRPATFLTMHKRE